MLQVCAWITVVVVMGQGVMGQDAGDFPDEWEAADLPNPWRSPQHCGLEKPGYICDPDRLLTLRQMELLDWLLNGFYVNDTKCPCSTYWCERVHRGTHMSIAVIRKLKLADTFEDRNKAILQSASNFALKLQESVWNFGDCENDIVIVYAKDDGVLFVSYGKTVGHYINNDIVNHVQYMYGYEFKEGGDVLTGFIQIILAMRQILNGYNRYDPNQPYFEQLIGGASYVQSSGVLATVALSLMARRWSSQ